MNKSKAGRMKKGAKDMITLFLSGKENHPQKPPADFCLSLTTKNYVIRPFLDARKSWKINYLTFRDSLEDMEKGDDWEWVLS